ncbi:MAG: TetR/AcrR family transcriptional regulator [Hyphomonadaceae bacterium]
MSTKSQSKIPWPKLETVTEDGRRQRSDRSRRRIIEALFDLIGEGNMSPSAVSVAERAEVGLRTVFRHFEDMDSIYDEMTAELTEAIKPKIEAPYEATTWRERLMESVDKRADIYETVFPMKVCMSLRRFQSDFIKEQYERDIALMRSTLKSILPKEITSQRTLFAALETTLAFTTWRRLRQDQNLSVENAKESIRLMLNGLVADIDVA